MFVPTTNEKSDNKNAFSIMKSKETFVILCKRLKPSLHIHTTQ